MLSRRQRRRLFYAAKERWRPIAAVATVSVCLIAIYTYPKPKNAPKPVPPTVVSVSTDKPTETKPASYRSTATGSQPKYLKLPSIKAEGYVQKVGIDQRKQVAVPTNIHLAGWFVHAVTPGEPGLSIIDGHLDGRTQPGIFAKLDKLKLSDTFTVELANGVTRQFLVVSVQSLPVADAAAVLFSQTPGVARQLNLITCAGTYKGAAGYDHRVIVTSRLIR